MMGGAAPIPPTLAQGEMVAGMPVDPSAIMAQEQYEQMQMM
jgi:hypothetical protein